MVRDVVLIDTPMVLAPGEDVQRLTRWQPLKLRNHDLDDEVAARAQMCTGVTEARDLSVLRRQVHDRVADEVHELEGSIDLRRREITDRDREVVPAFSSATIGRDRSTP